MILLVNTLGSATMPRKDTAVGLEQERSGKIIIGGSNKVDNYMPTCYTIGMRTMTTNECNNCGKTFSITKSDVNRGRGQFCGKSCAASGKNNSSYKHGFTKTREYKIWCGMRSRVKIGNELNRKYYKDRGITVCDRWQKSFQNFLNDMGSCPSEEHSIDRINPDGNYEPENCRWATRVEQMNNTRSNVLITFKGRTLTQEQWGQETGLGGLTIYKRLKRGWSVERALSEPLKLNWSIDNYNKAK